MMRSLTLSVRTLQGKANVLQPVQPPKPLPSKPIPPATSQPGSFFPNATFEPRTRTIGYRKWRYSSLSYFKCSFSIWCFFINFPSNSTTPPKSKTARREHSGETVAVILTLRNLGKSFGQIGDHVKLPRSTIVHIIHRAARKPEEPYRPTKRARQPAKLDARARWALIRHVERNPEDNLAVLGTPSKTGHKLGHNALRAYLKAAGYLRFKVRKKPYLKKQKEVRLCWAREYVGWELGDWMRIMWTDEAAFETGFGLNYLLFNSTPRCRNGISISKAYS